MPHPNKKFTQCYKCRGKFPHKGSCPATSAKCDVCQKIGHYGRMCCHRDRNKDVQAVQTTEDTTSDDDHYMVPCITVVTVAAHKYVTVLFKHAEIRCIVDTGPQVNIMSESTYRRLGTPELLQPGRPLFAYGPERAKTPLLVIDRLKGCLWSPIMKKETVAEFYVMQGNAETLLGQTSSLALGLVKFLQNPMPSRLDRVL